MRIAILIHHCCTACCLNGAIVCFAMAQEPQPAALANVSLEKANESGAPDEWSFIAQPKNGQSAALDDDRPAEGKFAARLDCTNSQNKFANLMQSLDAAGYQGKRVRFRAAVRTAELAAGTRVQLWFRVDRPSGVGGFDNMQDRPIDTDDWKRFDIVLNVADNAKRLNVGMFVIGDGKAWMDDASLEIVDDDTKTTGSELRSAMTAATDAPQQPFFNRWWWLVLIGCSLFVLSQVVPRRRTEFDDEDDEDLEDDGEPLALHWLPKYALRFSFVYWFLYSFPRPFGRIFPVLTSWLTVPYARAADSVVRWTASSLMGIEGELVAPNGSGDTTYAYVRVLIGFVLALLIATIWSALDRRATDGRVTKDLLRSYLRYVLAATMIGYGLAKLGSVQNQFPIPGEVSLARSYGESSPMGLLWTFMGASRSYTMFAGMGEVIGGFLLLWRRTTTLGAMVVFGVMVNVLMLNLCYDVPVKQYSAHLVLMALFLFLPEARRLLNLLVLNRSTEPVALASPYVGPFTIWLKRFVKLLLVLFVFVIPFATHVVSETQQAKKDAQAEADSDDDASAEVDEDTPLLMRRGFRWINEVPFNR